MNQTPCPNCGWVHPPKPRQKYPPEHYRNNTTPIEINFRGEWESFRSVTEASRVTGIKTSRLFAALRKGTGSELQVRLAKAGIR
mgnify:FL=1